MKKLESIKTDEQITWMAKAGCTCLLPLSTAMLNTVRRRLLIFPMEYYAILVYFIWKVMIG